MISSEMLNARREAVKQAYNCAKAENSLKFLKGDPKATQEYIFENQRVDAENIVNEFYNNKRRVVSIAKKTKVGMDGLMIEIAHIMTTHSDDSFVIDSDNVRILTGMSNVTWAKEMKEKSPNCFKDKIFHHGQLGHANINNLQNALIIIDEIDTGDKETQVLHETLHKAGVFNIDYVTENNIRFVVVSATMTKELYHLYQWGELHYLYKMTIPENYIGHTEFLEMGIIKQYYPLENIDNCMKWVREDILENYLNDYRVHIVRLTNDTENTIRVACLRLGVEFKIHTSAERLSVEEETELFKEQLEKHVVLGVKGFYRRANLIPNAWKVKIGATHELWTKVVDNNVQIQGLPGRMTGYWKDIVMSGHKTGPYRTSIKAVKEYEVFFNDPFGINNYTSSGFRKVNGKVKAKATMLSASNIEGLVPTPLPVVEDEEENEEGVDEIFDITDVYVEHKDLSTFLKGNLIEGKIIKYNSTNNEIKYDGNSVQMTEYVDKATFKQEDIYAGVAKNVTPKNIVCRIMPVLQDNQVRYVGIYNKNAFRM